VPILDQAVVEEAVVEEAVVVGEPEVVVVDGMTQRHGERPTPIQDQDPSLMSDEGLLRQE